MGTACRREFWLRPGCDFHVGTGDAEVGDGAVEGELFEQIRRDRRVGRLSVRELAENRHVHRRTVRQALASAVPPPRKAYARPARAAIDAYVVVTGSWLLAGRDVPRKQRHTARRVWQRLVAEHGATWRR